MIADELGLTHQRTQLVIERTLDMIMEMLATEGQVELRNFGTLKIKDRPSRMGRNPKTGEPVQIPERTAITFSAGKMMIERVSQYRSRRANRKPSSDVSAPDEPD